MSKYHILFLLALLPGCKGCGGNLGDNHGLGFQTDQQSKVTGISVRTANADSLTVDEIDALYYSTAACMNVIQADGKPPMAPRYVLYVPEVNPSRPGLADQEWNDTATIAVSDHLRKTVFGEGSWRWTAHGMVHWLQFMTTGDADAEHKSEFFKTCVGHYTGGF